MMKKSKKSKKSNKPSQSPTRFAVVALALFALPLSACDQLTSDTQAVSFLTRTPDLAAAQGLGDSGLLSVLPLDDFDDAGVFALTGAVRGDNLADSEKVPLVDAQVTLSFGTTAVDLCETIGEDASDGTYAASNVENAHCSNAALTYQAGATYRTELVTAEDTYAVEVVAPEALDPTEVTFNPAFQTPEDHFGASMQSHPRNTDLVADWSTSPQAGDRPFFTAVFRIKFEGSGPLDALDGSKWQVEEGPVFDDLPKKPADMINLILNQPPTSVTIPGNTFDTAGVYFIIITATELSTTTERLLLGSGALAGYGTAFAVWVD